jgi:hypothetical protein
MGVSGATRAVVIGGGIEQAEPADEVEEKLAIGLGEGQISEFVQEDEVHPGQMLGKAALTSIASLGLGAIDEIDDVVEAAAGTGSDAASGDGNGQTRAMKIS